AVEHGEPLDLAATTERVLETRAGEIQGRRLQIDTDLDHAWTIGSPQLVERLVANLLDNAIRHNTAAGWLRVTTEDRDRATLTVTNSGPVIPPTDLQRLKQPFQRLAADRANSGDGHGLGLSIVTAIVTAHGGTLNLEARPEGGLRAQVELSHGPVHSQSAPAVPATASQQPPRFAPPAAAGGGKVP
ncbi:MAG: sensor histidine kinase, partial [Trebonia sp.]